MYSQIKQNNRLVIQNMIHSFDRAFQSIDDTLHTVDVIKGKQSNIYKAQGHKNLDMLVVNQIRKNLLELGSSQPYIEEIVIYFANSDLAITTQGTIDVEELFEKRYSNKKYNASFWSNFNYTKHPTKVLPPSTYTNQFQGNQKKELIAVVNSNMMNYYSPSILIFIDKQKLFDYVNENNIFQGTSLTILDQEKNVIITIGDPISLEEIETNEMIGTDIKMKGKQQFEYSIVRSSYNNYTYIHAAPVSYIDMFKAIQINQGILVLNMISGIGIAILLSIYLYRPIKKIAEIVGPIDYKGKDYWTFIKTNIIKMQEEKNTLVEQVDAMGIDVKKRVVLELIQTKKWDTNLSKNVQQYFATFYTNKKYMMISFAFYKKPTVQEPISLPLNKIEIDIKTKLQNYFTDCFFMPIGTHEIISIIGMPLEYKENQIRILLQQILNNFNLQDHIPVIYRSNFYSKEHEFSQAYQDLQVCKSYRSIFPSKQVIGREQIEYKHHIYFPNDVKDKIYHFILSANAKDCIAFIHEILDENIKQDIAYTKYINIVTEIFNSIIATLGFCDYQEEAIFQIEENFMKMLNEDAEDQEIRWLLEAMIQQAAEKIEKSKENKLFIMEYINLHYMEGLYLESMAELVETSPKYFSNFFKREFGINFVEYLNSIRISHAKAYLKDTDMAVNEIGQKVGYLSPSTFATTFKKYTGVSPSQYRQNMEI